MFCSFGLVKMAAFQASIVMTAIVFSLTTTNHVVAQKTDGETDSQSDDQTPSIKIKILNEDGKPFAGAGLHVGCWFPDSQYRTKYKRDQKADQNGEINVDLLPTLERIRFWVSGDDHVTLFAGFEPGMLATMPKEMTFTLQRSIAMGGKVVDESGEPVVGAKIEITREGGGTKLDKNDFSRLGTWIAYGDEAVVTDKDGKWSLDQRLPSGDDLDVRFKITHPDFLVQQGYGFSIEKMGTTLAKLRDRSAVFSLEKGRRAKGQVVDDEGKPIAGAMIVWGDRPYHERGSQEQKTDDDGRFNVPAQKAEKINLTVVAKGWKPIIKNFDFSKPVPDIKFQLEKGSKLHLKFVDTKNAPIPNVRVFLKSWREKESLYNYEHPNVMDSQVPKYADENGEYVWDWAPDDEIVYSVSHQTRATQKIIRLTADGSTQTIVLNKKFSLSGSIVDNETGDAINEFSITPVTCYKGGRGIAQSNSMQHFKSSNFQMQVDEFGHHEGNVKFEIEAPGYRVAVTEEFTPDAEPFNGVIRLDPAPAPKGKAVDSEGNPVPNAAIFVATIDNGIMINDVDEYFNSMERMYKSDKDGNFTYPAQRSRVAIAIASEKGYAESYLGSDEDPGEMKMQPWARVEGQLLQEGKPVPDAWVLVGPIRSLGNGNPHLQDRFSTKTDSKGRFVFDKVPPVPSSISSQLSPWRDYPITSNRIVSLDLEPGKTHKVSLGGDGIQIVGRVKLEGDGKELIEFRYGLNTLLKVGSRLKLADHLINVGEFDVGENQKKWMKLTDGTNSTSGYESHFVKLNPDGSFLINGVQPGDYRFLFRIYQPPSGCLVDPIGSELIEFSTSDYKVTDNQIDMGKITVKLNPYPNAGEPLPTFRYTDLEGSQKTSDQLLGQVVLIDYWATWCKPCIALLPEMKRINKIMEGREGFLLLGLSLDKELDLARDFVKERDLPWAHGFLGGDKNNTAQKSLGISSVPHYCLVDQDGTILERGYDLEAIEKKLKEVFKIK